MTGISLDEALVEEARKLSGHRTKKAAVTEALQEYVQRHKQQRILELFGPVDYDEGYDPLSERKKP